VGQTANQLLAIAGRSSGQILVLLMRALSILWQALPEPHKLLMCTCTEVDPSRKRWNDQAHNVGFVMDRCWTGAGSRLDTHPM
jgi:hypothetical protein